MCHKNEPVEISYKGAPQLCRQTGNGSAFSQFHIALPIFVCSQTPFSCTLPNQPEAPATSLHFTQIKTTTISSISVPYSPPFSLLPPSLVPGRASVLDQTGGGVVLLWRLGSSWKSPVYECLFIQPPH